MLFLLGILAVIQQHFHNELVYVLIVIWYIRNVSEVIDFLEVLFCNDIFIG